MFRIPWKYVDWTNSSFLIGTLALTLTAVPAYILTQHVSAFQWVMFAFFVVTTALSITLGYHRLFSHLSFKAKWPVRLFTLLFGAAAFEGSAICWTADHRRHHKHVDHDDDPYDISKGLFHAHIGWLLFKLKPQPPFDNVGDLRGDRMVVLQDRYYVPVAVFMCFALPALIGFAVEGWIGALGGFLLAGVGRVTVVQHMTFCINSLCHWIGRRPYSTRCSARDSVLMALFTFGEGYHNFHHEFQHDFRNGVKPWQWDPTKWTIFVLSKVGLVSNLRRVPEAKILAAEIAEHERVLQQKLESRPLALTAPVHSALEAAHARLSEVLSQWEGYKVDYQAAMDRGVEASRQKIAELRKEFRELSYRLREALRQWEEAHQFAGAMPA